MALVLKTAPTVEPISLAEAKLHLRLDSGSFADNISSAQAIAPGSHIVATSFSLIGAVVEVLGYSVVVNLDAGTCGSGGSVTVKLQESDDNIAFTDVTGGAFTVVTEANDNAIQELAYTGGKQYLNAVATVAVVACEFSVTVIKGSSVSDEDLLLTSLITAARQYCETFQRRAYINQTWELWLDGFPSVDFINIPLPPLSSVISIDYYDTSNTKTTMTALDYFVDTKSAPGRVVLAYGKSWPSDTLRPANGVCITFTAGYGDEAADVPLKIRQAILLAIGHLYEHRDDDAPMPGAVDALLWQERAF